jgi:threonine/homoserine/homoserine lactone efflux protein
MSPELFLAYLIATIVIIIVPGPTVTLIIANSLRYGPRAGLLNVAGGQFGIALMIALVGLGLASLIEAMGFWFVWVKLAGAAYLIWLGLKLIRSPGAIGETGTAPKPRGGFFLQGFLVAVSNPKTLVFFGAFIPQFIDPARDYGLQIAIMGATAIVVASISDGMYAVLVGGAGRKLSQRAIRWLSRVSGGMLISGGAWLALNRQ